MGKAPVAFLLALTVVPQPLWFVAKPSPIGFPSWLPSPRNPFHPLHPDALKAGLKGLHEETPFGQQKGSEMMTGLLEVPQTPF